MKNDPFLSVGKTVNSNCFATVIWDFVKMFQSSVLLPVHFTIFCLLASIALISNLVPCRWLNSDVTFFPKEVECSTVLHQSIACWEGVEICIKPKSRTGPEVQLVIHGGIMPQILCSVLKISTYKLYTNKYVNL